MKKFFKGFAHALNGLQKAIVSELNLKVHLIIAVCVVIMGFITHLNANEWAIIIGCIALVIAAELMNTAIEKLVDLVSPAFHPQAGLVKDIAAAAVLVCAVASAIIGCIIFIPKLF